MSKKPKLLAWCDFLVPTGFGTVSKNLFEDMYKDYDVSVVGINYHGDRKYDTSKYFVYSVQNNDLLGIKRLPKIIEREQPDILFLFQDIFHISDIINDIKKMCPAHTKIVSYFPVDGEPFSMAWGNVLEKSDSIITYTDWAIEVIKDRFPKNDKPISKLYHGVNLKDFYPKTEKEIAQIRKQYGWSKKFVVANINRFQPRKFIPGGARAFSMFAKGYKQCAECNHRMPHDRNRCELCTSSDLDKKGTVKKDVFMWFHMMPKEPSMGPSRGNLLQNHLLNAGFTDPDVGSILGVNARNIYGGEVPVSDINDLYNAANINISSTLGEGCGLSLIEAQAAGTPSIAPRNSAIPEMLQDTGWIVDNAGVINQALDNAHIRPVVDCGRMMDALEEAYKDWKSQKCEVLIDQDCIDNVNDLFLWEDKRTQLRDTFSEVLRKSASKKLKV